MSRKRKNQIIGFFLFNIIFLFLYNRNSHFWSYLPEFFSRYKPLIQQGLFYVLLSYVANIVMNENNVSLIKLGYNIKELYKSIPILIALIFGHIIITNLLRDWYVKFYNANFYYILISLLFTAIIPPFFEEYIYRGSLQNALYKEYTLLNTILLSSIGFSIAHIFTNQDVIILHNNLLYSLLYMLVPILNRFIFGLYYGISYHITRNLFITSFIHSFHNITYFYFPSTEITIFILFIYALPLALIYIIYPSRIYETYQLIMSEKKLKK